MQNDLENLRKELERKVKKIFIVPYAHCDWVCGHWRPWHEERYSLIFNETLDLMKRDPDYRWFFDSWNEELRPFAENYPRRMEELKRRVMEGRIGVVGIITGGQFTRFGGELFIRNMQYGRSLFEKEFPGADLTVMTAIDTVLGCSQFPQLIRKAGFKYFRFNHPSSSSEMCDAKNVPREFFWQGLDGTRLLTSRWRYGTRVFQAPPWGFFPYGFKEDWEKAFKAVAGNLLDVANLVNTGILWVPLGGDDARPLRGLWHRAYGEDRCMPIPALVEEWNSRERIPMIFGTPLDYFKEIEKQTDELTTVKAIIEPVGYALPHYGGGIGYSVNDVNEQRLLRAEKFSAIASLLGDEYREDQLAEIWFDLLSTQGHATEGSCAEGYDELVWIKNRALKEADEISMKALKYIAGKVEKKQDVGLPVIVFNEFSWDRRDIVSVNLSFIKANEPVRNFVVKNSEGRVAPHQILDYQPYENGAYSEVKLVFIAEVPSLGYATYYIVPTEEETIDVIEDLKEEPSRIENEHYTTMLKDGRIDSLYDKHLAMELIRANDESTGNEVVFYSPYQGPTRGWKIVIEEIGRLKDASTELLENGPLRTRLLTRGKIREADVQQETIIYNHSRRIDFVAYINSEKENGMFWARFPFTFPGKIMADVPFGVEERDLSNEPIVGYSRPEGSEGIFYGTCWCDYGSEDRQYGVTLIHDSVVRYQYRIKPEEMILEKSLLWVRDLRKVWISGEKWGNPRLEGRGPQSIRYSIYPHEGDWKKAESYRRALEYLNPLIAYVAWGESAKELPEEKTFLKISNTNTALSTLQREENSLIARIYDKHGTESDTQLTFPFEIESIEETDFNGKPMKSNREISVSGHKIDLIMKPWEIVTLRITPQRREPLSVTSQLSIDE